MKYQYAKKPEFMGIAPAIIAAAVAAGTTAATTIASVVAAKRKQKRQLKENKKIRQHDIEMAKLDAKIASAQRQEQAKLQSNSAKKMDITKLAIPAVALGALAFLTGE